MIKLVVLTILIGVCCAQQTFPIRAVSMISGVIISQEAMQNMQAMMFQQQQQQMQGGVQQQGAGMQEGMDMGVTVIMGKVQFLQESLKAPVKVRVNITFVPPMSGKRLRGLHIHSFGISSSSENVTEVCGTTGPHFNPQSTQHGSLDSAVRHAGDLGNVMESNGIILTDIVVPNMTLNGPESIVGRAVVLHEKTDDEGTGKLPSSKVNGDAGARIACGNVVYTN